MLPKSIYLDYASTTPLDTEVFDAYTQLLKDQFYNVDALYSGAIALKNYQEKSRQLIASMFSVRPEEIIFTSGASEANNMILKGLALKQMGTSRNTMIISSVEHSSVKESAAFCAQYYGTNVIEIGVNEHGLDYEALEKALNHDVFVVAVMAINNETGMQFDAKRISDLIKKKSHAFFHVDSVQAIGKIPLDFVNYVDSLALSAHKLHGLKGSGLLLKRRNISIPALISAGQQEYHLRGGTSNACTNIVLAKTIRKSIENQQKAYANALRCFDICYQAFKEDPDFHINSPVDCSPFIFNVSSLRTTSQVMLNALNHKGLCVSATSTCESDQGNSEVLKAMGYNEIIQTGSLRLSFDISTSIDDVTTAINAIKEVNQIYATR